MLAWSLLLLFCAGGCSSTSYLSVRKIPINPLSNQLALLSRSGPKPSQRTEMLLRKYDLEERQKNDPAEVLKQLQQEISVEPTTDKMYAFAELSYILGKRAKSRGRESQALDLFSSSVAHSYLYLFSPKFEGSRNVYDPQFRLACDIYNSALEDLLRIVNDQGRLRPGENYTLTIGDEEIAVQIMTRGRWRPNELERFEFASDYEVEGLINRHITYGLGVPLIAVRSQDASCDPAADYYPAGMSVPVTAIIRAVEQPCDTAGNTRVVRCVLEMHDALASDRTEIAGHYVPLETDLTTPLGYYLDNPQFNTSDLATWGLLDPGGTSEVSGLYMLEAFDPGKIPVLLVHGLWSSPETWTEMVNELRSLPEIRNRYQFWSYLYPTGQPFWISATQLRAELQSVRDRVDPHRQWPALDQMVLIGHSMGGLVSRMQAIDAQDDFWNMISERPFEALEADNETRIRLASTVFFQPSPSIRRVITIGTPHRGSDFANDYTRWLGRKLIKLPKTLVQTKKKILRDNPEFFRNSEILTINTSIDSLSPSSPILPVMLAAHKSPQVKFHNVVGVVSKKDLLGRISETGDGVVGFDSAHLDDVESEIVVEADHVHVHQHPRTILEVRRILLTHSMDMYAEAAYRAAIPAGYQSQLGFPGDNTPFSMTPYSTLEKPVPLPGVRWAIGDMPPLAVEQ